MKTTKTDPHFHPQTQSKWHIRKPECQIKCQYNIKQTMKQNMSWSKDLLIVFISKTNHL
uniref:Uncharacterized protein n=1 Tax=Rhizophora mucronata TaxID=61149 RepID=A0A2P2L1E3_RHIMU